MKNQYVGDIGDFGKYSLLRAFSDERVRIGVNWHLTENDDSNDGKFTGYLAKGKLRKYSPEVFDTLQEIATKPDKSVEDIEESGIIADALFYNELLNPVGTPNDREQERVSWFRESVYELEAAELIFLDPDNGLFRNDDSSARGAEKYALPEEVESYFLSGKNVVYYCHKGRRTDEQWNAYKKVMFDRVKEAKPLILTYHKGSQRSYVFLIHEADYSNYRRIVDKFIVKWDAIFTEETLESGSDIKAEHSRSFKPETVVQHFK